ncbi:hypothetical protein pqer_cds_491 [Pandoravirus quercus]|uniref:Uncharacterized protein n=2 Tax=Pandoravirus TaxID=2060084 RepID=A0A2U7U900_9VIRU|nr:hypothetical protein pqer_cds_491 [Pandoravirus quercus]AVK74913.1 hypothetical protein pqer_cds_491 [Pandoravirus quercus]QBZ81099.1 hypothetical protein pclt_cds_505 [Pandoravirus celtis]
MMTPLPWSVPASLTRGAGRIEMASAGGTLTRRLADDKGKATISLAVLYDVHECAHSVEATKIQRPTKHADGRGALFCPPREHTWWPERLDVWTWLTPVCQDAAAVVLDALDSGVIREDEAVDSAVGVLNVTVQHHLRDQGAVPLLVLGHGHVHATGKGSPPAIPRAPPSTRSAPSVPACDHIAKESPPEDSARASMTVDSFVNLVGFRDTVMRMAVAQGDPFSRRGVALMAHTLAKLQQACLNHGRTAEAAGLADMRAQLWTDPRCAAPL